MVLGSAQILAGSLKGYAYVQRNAAHLWGKHYDCVFKLPQILYARFAAVAQQPRLYHRNEPGIEIGL